MLDEQGIKPALAAGHSLGEYSAHVAAGTISFADAVRAVVITKHGGPGVLQVQERPDPVLGPGEVRIDVAAAGVNFADVMARLGLYADAPKTPCVVGYAEIAARLVARPEAQAQNNPYRVWIDEYAGAPYQEVAMKARAHLDRLANLYVTPEREAELVTIFKEATRLETDFWEMGWRAK